MAKAFIKAGEVVDLYNNLDEVEREAHNFIW